eukprot:1158729-Pelagomonas_calceolata.AAC.3
MLLCAVTACTEACVGRSTPPGPASSAAAAPAAAPSMSVAPKGRFRQGPLEQIVQAAASSSEEERSEEGSSGETWGGGPEGMGGRGMEGMSDLAERFGINYIAFGMLFLLAKLLGTACYASWEQKPLRG